ncbi:hypothetical protein N7491_003526 [Penicillium cf. griseofulvum]|nr:hypothetical protein N7491_003526 [Penicillium cf. griseofulvum]
MPEQPPPLKHWPHSIDQRYVFRCLGIADSVDDQLALRDLGQLVYNIIADEAMRRGMVLGNLFRSSALRTQILYEWRKRLLMLPTAVRNHVTDLDLLSGALYKYLNCIQDDLLAVFEAQHHEAQQREDVSPDGDWINIANIRFELFKQNLIQEGFMVVNPQPGESRLTSFNLASTLLRTIREHWPRLRNPSPDPYSLRRSPLPRPNLTIIIRGGNVKGGALSTKQPALARPAGLLGDNLVTPNRRMEQMARYKNNRHNNTKRKRAEAEADNGTEEGAPAAQKRREMPKTVTPPVADDAAAPANDPTIDPALAPDPAWQDPLMGDDDDASLQALLDHTMFNDQGPVGNGSADLQTFFEENECAAESIEED